eukprot:gene486-875_t
MSVGMFPDGSNPEGIDPSPAVPWNSKADLMNRNVYVYGSTRSAPSNKLCTVLLANDIPFQRVDCSAPAPGSVGRFYRKIPIIVVGERQVNDSGIILKNLIPALAQSSPQMEYNAGWDQRITYELDPTIRNVIQRSDGSRLGGCCMGKSVVDHMNREAKKAVNPGGAFKVGDVDDLHVIMKDFKAEFGEYPFFGGVNPGSVDIAMYGQLAIYIHSKCDFCKDMIAAASLQDWQAAMMERLPLKRVFSKSDNWFK